MNNAALRQHIRQQRRALSEDEREQASFQICERIASSRLFQQAQHIAFYLSNDAEVDLILLMEHAWQRGKTVYLPVLAEPNTKKLWFIPCYPGTRLKNNRFGIAEPVHPHKMRSRKPLSLDLILMPLVAFDENGHRLGMGGGFYDRSFAFLQHRRLWHKPRLLGVAYELQKQKRLQTQPWDIPLQAVATEKDLYKF